VPGCTHPFPLVQFSITADLHPALSPELDLDGMGAQGILHDEGLHVVHVKDRHVVHRYLLSRQGVGVRGSQNPAQVRSFLRIVPVGNVGVSGAVWDEDIRGGFPFGRRIVGKSPTSRHRAFVPPFFLRHFPQRSRVGEEGVFVSLPRNRYPVKPWVSEPVGEGQVGEIGFFDHPGDRRAGAGVHEKRLHEHRDLQIDEPGAPHGAYPAGIVTVEDRREPGDAAFRQMFEHHVGLVQAVLGPGSR